VRRVALLLLLVAACGPSSMKGGEVAPTLPGDDPVKAGQAAPVKKAGQKGKVEPDPWAGKKDLIQAPPAKPAGKVALPAVERFELANGLKVLVVPNHKLPVVSFRLAVLAGQEEEPHDKRGLADFVAAMLTKGTKSKNAEQLAQTIDQVGGAVQAGVDLEATHLSCDVMVKDAATCLTILPDLVTNATFPAQEMDEIRKQIVGAVKQRRDDPGALAEDHFDNLLWGDDHVRGWPVTLETIAAIGRQDLVDWHTSRFKPGNAILVVAGDIDAKDARAQLQKAFAGWKKAAAPEPKKFPEPKLEARRVRLVDKPDLPQALIRVGSLGISHADPDYLATMLANYTLGGGQASSRLMKNLHGAGGKVYQGSSQFERLRQRGSFQAQTVVALDDAVSGLNQLIGEIVKMAKDGPSEAELSEAKANLSGNYALGFESVSATAAAIMAAELHGLGESFVREFPARLAAVPLADVRAAAKKHLDAGKLVVVMVGKAAEIAPQLKKAGIAFEQVDALAPVSKRDREAAVAARNAPPDPKKAAEGKKLIDQAIAARGGEKKLTGLKELRASGKLTIHGQGGKSIDGEVVRYLKSAAGTGVQQRSDITLPGKGTIKLVVSPNAAWVEFQNKVQDVPKDSLAAINLLLFVDPERVLLHGLDKSFLVQAEGKQKVDNTDYDGVRVRSPDGAYEVLLLLDVKTHLVYRVVYSVEGNLIFDEYADYKPVNGVQIAHKVKTVNLLLQAPVDIEYQKIEVNAGLPAGTFDKP
jgi:zinc protease